MKNVAYILLVILFLTGCQSRKPQVQSPDGRTILSFELTEQGEPTYSLLRNGVTVLASSHLGLVAEQTDFSTGLQMLGISHNKENSTWETVWGEEQYITDRHNELTVHLRQTDGRHLDIVFRLFNDGMALRYVFPDKDTELTITDDRTEYCFTADHNAWSIPWRTAYYEALWKKAPLSQKDTMCSPITLELCEGGYAFLHEANITNYPAQNLYTDGTCVRTYLTPWLDTNKQPMAAKAYIQGEFATPWHMLILTETLPELIASRIMLNLNEPLAIADAREWIKPMKFIGIWWGMHIKTMTWHQGPQHGATTENMKRYLQFAADHHIEAVLAEGWNKGWEDWSRFYMDQPYDDWDMGEIAHFADSIGVSIVGHNETGGNAALYEQELDKAYAYHRAHGIHAIKTGYVSPVIRTLDGLQLNKGQSGVRHYRKVIETAARYHIAIDNHEPVMPSGLQRTYPNLMTQEGVRGQEWNAWSRDGGSPCEHVTVLPFTRIMAGPVDYTPGVFHFENPVIPETRVHSTLMNQLALFVCFYSPLQMACDLPESYMEHPDAFHFIEDVPCDWKQSRLLDGAIGDYMIMARQDRNSDDWYVGGITDEQAREVEVCFDFLDPKRTYTLTLYRDGEDAQWESHPYAYLIESREIKQGDRISVRMAEGGGFAMRIAVK